MRKNFTAVSVAALLFACPVLGGANSESSAERDLPESKEQQTIANTQRNKAAVNAEFAYHTEQAKRMMQTARTEEQKEEVNHDVESLGTSMRIFGGSGTQLLRATKQKRIVNEEVKRRGAQKPSGRSTKSED